MTSKVNRNSGVTTWWLLRLVTGVPLVGPTTKREKVILNRRGNHLPRHKGRMVTLVYTTE